MEKNQSPHSPGMNLKRIELPEAVITYFQQRGRFIRGLPSYEQIEGRNPLLPEEIEENLRFGIFIYETYPVNNNTSENVQKAECYARETVSTFTRNKPREISKLSREYMLMGYTRPIRINFLMDKKIQSAVYVKKPSIERIFGMYLYNFLSGSPSQDYLFNNYTFLEKEISGVHLDDENKQALSSKPRFKESAIRLATLDDFMAISDLERKSGPKNALTNILVQYDGSITAFDFNTVLQPFVEFTRSPFLDRLREMGIDIPKRLEKQITAEEALRINHVINQHRACFESIVELIDKVPYMKSRIEEKGYKSAKKYFKDALYKLRRKII